MGEYLELLVAKDLAGWGAEPPGSEPRLIYTALFEAFLLHARNVLEFVKLAPNANKRSARTFASQWDSAAARMRVQPLYEEICTKLSHIGVARTPTTWTPVDVGQRALAEFEAAVAIATEGDVATLIDAATTCRAAVDRVAAHGTGPLVP
jgi:hypothetical protein